MKINENEKVIELISDDENGEFKIRLCKLKPHQLQIETSNGDHETYMNLDLLELKAIKEMITKAINNKITKNDTNVL